MSMTMEPKIVLQAQVANLGQPARHPKKKAIWEWNIVRRALWDSLVKLNPQNHDG